MGTDMDVDLNVDVDVDMLLYDMAVMRCRMRSDERSPRLDQIRMDEESF